MKKNLKKRTSMYVLSAIIIILSIIFVLPFLEILSASFTSDTALRLHGYSIIPRDFTIDSYKFIFQNSMKEILSSYGVTIFVSVVGTVLGIVIMSGMAYPLSRKDFKYSKSISFFLYFTMLFSGGMVPTYILISNYLKLKDTIWVLILPLMLSAWNIFLLRSYFSAVPNELIESAKIDGANEVRIFYKVIIPLAKPGIATISLFTILMFWNEWFMSMLYINSDKIVSLQYMLCKLLNNVEFITKNASGMLNSEQIPKDNIRMATCILAAGPMILVFPFFQKYFVKGITVGSIKG